MVKKELEKVRKDKVRWEKLGDVKVKYYKLIK